VSEEGHAPGLWPVPGDGVLARRNGLVLLSSLDDGQFVDVLLDLLERVAASAGDGREFADSVAQALEESAPAEAAETEPSVLAFGATAAGLAVTVGGGAWADVTTAHGVAHVAASQPGMLVRCVLRSPFAGIRGGLSPSDNGTAATDRFSRLDAGTVRAGGLAYFVDDSGSRAPGSARPASLAKGAAKAGQAEAAATPAPAQPEPSTPKLAKAPKAEPAAAVPEPEPAAAEIPEPEPASPEPAGPEIAQPAPAGAEVPVELSAPASPAASGPASEARYEPTTAYTPPPDEPVQGTQQWTPDWSVAGEQAQGVPLEPTIPPEPFEAVLLTDAGAASGLDVVPRQALSLAGKVPKGTSSYVSQGPLIQGVYCTRGHFDDPEARFCAVCGISMNQQTLVPRPGERPPLGLLLLDDGSVFQLDTDYIVGREPGLEASVAAGKSRPLRITDDSGIVSRVHARVQLDGWRVLVTDLGSANGTRVKLPNEPADQQLVPQVPVVLATGSQVDLGGRGFRYESHRGR
jgi:FHA domain